MLSDEIFKISIPSDNDDGFIIIKCSISNEKFMIQIEDANDDSLIDIWCPRCGLKSDYYLDDDVNNLSLTRFHANRMYIKYMLFIL